MKWQRCTGEAHSNPYIDNCMVCAPYWGQYPVCDCGSTHTKLTKKFIMCMDCGKHYDRLSEEAKREIA